MLCRSLFLMERLTGTCVFQSSGRKPFGFLADKNNVEHYWKSTSITASVKPIKTLKVGETVEFEIVEIDGKKQAGNVTAPGGGPVEGADKRNRESLNSNNADQRAQGLSRKVRGAFPAPQQLAVSRPRSSRRRRTVPTMMGGSAYNDALFGVP